MKLLTPFLCPSLFSSLALSFSLHPRDDFDSIGLRWGPGILGSRSSIDQSKLHPKKQNKTKQNKKPPGYFQAKFWLPGFLDRKNHLSTC